MKKCQALISLALLFAFITGCNSKQDETLTKSPRPVSVLTLVETDPGRLDRYTGTVASWKSDKLGFEVAGRVQFVLEPETDIIEAASDDKGDTPAKGTQLARLDPTRYELQVQSAKAQIQTAEKQREAAQIELDSVIPAQQEAAQAQLELTTTQVERYRKLRAQNAVSQSDLDKEEFKLAESVAKLKQLKATRGAKQAEVASIDARIGELQEALREAERDVADCQLYWSVPGQVAEVHVIAGSYVERGEPVLTVQMMDPIKVEFEVAGTTARTLNHSDQVEIYVPQPDGTAREQLAFIYTIDPVADPRTRTFTITLMLSNERFHSEVPEELKGQVVARTDRIGKLIKGFGNKPNTLFVNEENLHQDDDGYFVWKILNRHVGTLARESQRVLKVKKVRVAPGEKRVPVLGLAVLREVQIPSGEQFDPAIDLISGKVVLPPGEEDAWSGDRVFYDVERWELRPGDLVSVDLAGQPTQPGFYVPLDAIMEKSGTNYVFVVDQSAGGEQARRVEVTVHDPVGTLRRIEPVSGQQLDAGMKVVAAGAVFLVDGQRVNVAEEVEVRR